MRNKVNYKSFNLGDWIGHISGVIEDETTLDGNEMSDLVNIRTVRSMTNEDKFKEVFGFKPDTEFSPFECPEPFASDKCKYYEELDGGCHCETWWNEQYKK